jgi:hypothetical protein
MDNLGIIVQKLKADALNYHNLKSAIVEYIGERGRVLGEQTSNTEYDYCEIVGRIKEINELTEFLLNSNLFTEQETKQEN